MIYEVSQRTIVRSRREKQFVRVVNMSSFAFCGGASRWMNRVYPLVDAEFRMVSSRDFTQNLEEITTS